MREIGKKRKERPRRGRVWCVIKKTTTQNRKYFSMAEAQSGTRFKIRGKKERIKSGRVLFAVKPGLYLNWS